MEIRALSIRRTSEAREAAAHALPQLLTELEGHSGFVNSATFSPDGQRVVTASEDGTATIHTLVTWENLDSLLEAK